MNAAPVWLADPPNPPPSTLGCVADNLYPLFPVGPLHWVFGNARGEVILGMGPYWPDPPFTTTVVPPGTHHWRYILPLPQLTAVMLDEPPSPWGPSLDIREVTLYRFAYWDGSGGCAADWWIGYAPEPNTYLLWQVPLS